MAFTMLLSGVGEAYRRGLWQSAHASGPANSAAPHLTQHLTASRQQLFDTQPNAGLDHLVELALPAQVRAPGWLEGGQDTPEHVAVDSLS